MDGHEEESEREKQLVETPRKRMKVFPANAPLFPNTKTSKKVKASLGAVFAKEKLFIVSCLLNPSGLNFSRMATLVANEQCLADGNSYIINFNGLMRVEIYELDLLNVNGEKIEKIVECSWKLVHVPEVKEESWNSDVLQSDLQILKGSLHLIQYYLEEAVKLGVISSPRVLEKMESFIVGVRELNKQILGMNRFNLGLLLDKAGGFLQSLVVADVVYKYDDVFFTVEPGERLKKIAPLAKEAAELWRDWIAETELKIQESTLFAQKQKAEAETGAGDSQQKNQARAYTKALIDAIFPEDEDLPEPAEKPEKISVSGELQPKSIALMRDFLSGRVMFQERAVRAAVRIFNMAKAGYFPPKGPLLKLFLSGPTGVGKTEFALALSDWLWKREKTVLERAKTLKLRLPFGEKDIARPSLVKVSCGDFAGENSFGVSNLIGSPVGYVGSRSDYKGAQPPVLRPQNFPPNRLTVLLFDEIEKAFIGSRNSGAELMGILMEILDTGKYKNRWEQEIDFGNTIVLFTSNIGSFKIMQSAEEPKIGIRPGNEKNGKRTKRPSDKEIEKLNDKIYFITKAEGEKIFPPEFRNRITSLIVFRFLTNSNYRAILKKEFAENIAKWAEENAGVKVELSEDAEDWILEEIHFEEGVRKLRELMEKEIAEPLARFKNLKMLRSGATYEVKIARGDEASVEPEIKVEFVVKRDEESGS